MLGNHQIDQVSRGIRQHQAGDAVDCHQQEPQRQQAAAGTNQLPSPAEERSEAWGCATFESLELAAMLAIVPQV